MASSGSNQLTTEEESGDSIKRQDAEWLSTLSESELDFLIALKELATRRAKNVGYKERDNKFDLRMLRALGFILSEYLKERVQSTSEIPDSAEISRMLGECGLSTLNCGRDSDKSSDKGTLDLSFVTPRRKRMWDGLREEGTAANPCKRKKTLLTDD